MKTVKFIFIFSIICLLLGCVPVNETETQTSTSEVIATNTSIPPISTVQSNPVEPIIWPGLKDGWMYFKRDTVGEIYPVYDPTGFFWARGANILYRWDVVNGNVKSFSSSDNNLPLSFSGYPVTIFDGRAWIINTGSGEVAYYSDDTWVSATSIPYEAGNVKNYPSFQHNSLISVTNNRLWMVGSHTDYSTCPQVPGILPPSCQKHYSGIYYFDGEDWKVFNQLPDSFSDYSYYVTQSKDGSFWFWNSQYVLRHDGAWREYKDLRGARIFTQADGTLLFRFETIIISFDGEKFTPLVFPENKYYYPIENSYLMPDSGLLVKVRNYYNDPNLSANPVYIIRNGRIMNFSEINLRNAPDDNINFTNPTATPIGWVFRFQNGFYLYDGNYWKKFEKPDSSSIYKAMGGFIIGFSSDGFLLTFDQNGIRRFDGVKNEYIYEGQICNNTSPYIPFEGVLNTGIDIEGNIWFANAKDNVMCYLNIETQKQEVFKLDFNIGNFVIDLDGSIWSISNKGYLAHFTLDSLRNHSFVDMELIKIGGDTINYNLYPLRIEIDVNGNIWILTENSGLYKYYKKSWKYYGLPNLHDSSAFAIDLDGYVWAGIQNKLLKHDGVKWIEYPIEIEFGRNILPVKIAFDTDNNVWFVNKSIYPNEEIAYRFDGTNMSKFLDIYSGTTDVGKIMIAPDGAVWFISSNQWTRYQE